MGFSARQLQALRRKLSRDNIRSREIGDRTISYIEGWHAIVEANRIFGFDGWSRETTESRCVLTRENRGTFLAVYLAKVRISVRAGTATIVREGHGTGESHRNSSGEAHDIALKAAETDATKRALATFGNPFGLSLYLSDKSVRPNHKTGRSTTTRHWATGQPDIERRRTFQRPNPTRAQPPSPPVVPIDRPSHEQAPQEGSGETSANPSGQSTVAGHCLLIEYPRRIRDRIHLRFVALQPCLICGRSPADPHHLRYAQTHGLGQKVSDEFTVPLCRTHHRELHQKGRELAWWESKKIDPLHVAKSLWTESHERRRP